MKTFSLFVLSSVAAFGQVASIIPSVERVDWTVGTNVGVRGGIPTNRTQYGSTIDPGASAATINAALAAASSGQYVLLGPGTFDLAETLVMQPHVTLRGSGRNVTKIHCSYPGAAVAMTGGSTVSAAGDITAGYAKDSVVITVSGGPSLSSGDIIGIYQDNESWIYNPDGTANTIYALYRVEAVNGSDVTIWPALNYGSTGFNPKFVKMTGTFLEGSGLEELSVFPDDPTADYPILINSTYGCWVKNVLMPRSNYVGIFAFQNLALEIAGFDVLGTDSVGDGYGIDLDNQTPGNNAIAIYDCIVSGQFHGILTSGTQRLVVAYSYSLNEHSNNGTVTQTAGFNASHAAMGMMCLWEGLVGNSMTSDRIHGAAAYQTVWRCRFTGNDNFFNLAKAATIYPTEGSYWWHVVGCVLGDTWAENTTKYPYEFTSETWDAAPTPDHGGIYLLGYVGWQTPLDGVVASTLTRYSNFDYGHGALQDTGAYTVDTSLAWAAKPSWYDGGAWGEIGTNPATRRAQRLGLVSTTNRPPAVARRSAVAGQN